MTAPLLTALPLAAEKSGSGSFLVQPGIGLMVWTLLVFAVAMLVLWKLAFPVISEALEKRQRAIDEAIDSANASRDEAQQLLAEYRERLKEARVQADEIIARAHKAGSEHERQALEEAKQTREDLLEQARKDIGQETQKALQDIRREIATLTVAATEHVTRRTLDEEDQRRLIDDALGELDFSVFGERR